MYHFKAIGKSNLKFQSGNAQFRSKSANFYPVWPWDLMDDLEKQYGTSSMLLQALYIIQSHRKIQSWITVRKLPIRVKSGDFFVPRDLEIWRLTLKDNRVPLLCWFKLGASFLSHQWILTGVPVRKHPIWVKIGDHFSCVTLKFDKSWLWKTIGHFFYATSSFTHHFKASSK